MNIAQFVYHSIIDYICVVTSLRLLRIFLLCTFLFMSVNLVSRNGFWGQIIFLSSYTNFHAHQKLYLVLPIIYQSSCVLIYAIHHIKQSF